MRRLSMATRAELKSVLARRYRVSSRVEKGRILDEFVAITGFHRKHAMRFLRSDPDGRTASRRNRPRIYQGGEKRADSALGGRGPGVRQASKGPAADLD